MKSLLSLTWLLLGSASASSAVAHIYLHDSTSPPTTDAQISPELAKLIFARRLGFSEYYSLSELEHPLKSIPQLNDFGGPASQPFVVNRPDDSANVFMLVEGVSSPKDLGLKDNLVQLSPAPNPKSTAQLVADFSKLASSVDSTLAQQPLPASLLSLAARSGNSIARHGDRIIAYIKTSVSLQIPPLNQSNDARTLMWN
jgi:hypothetical protein